MLINTGHNFFDYNKGTDYHGRADTYSLLYMPVNFYKIWLPLWKLLSSNNLPTTAKILELGPGPGTSTFSVIALYARLAHENPSVRFALDYTAVEREGDFGNIFKAFESKMLPELPKNLSVNMTLETPKDAFSYIKGQHSHDFDLILESNMLNNQEGLSSENDVSYMIGLDGALKEDGFAILVEPREYAQTTRIKKLIDDIVLRKGFQPFCPLTMSAVNTSGIKIISETQNAGIRYSKKTEHSFSYAILTRKEARNDSQCQPSNRHSGILFGLVHESPARWICPGSQSHELSSSQ